MPVSPGLRRALTALALTLLACAILGTVDAALAQGNPFGGARAPGVPPPDGLTGWLLAKQAEFYRQFAQFIRAARADGSAAWALCGVAFAYGVFHAAGPGHGKAVISSYMVANEETWTRGVVLAFASALLQALVAVALVGVGAVVLHATARQMTRAADLIEKLSYLLIVLIGLRLLWVKGSALLQEWMVLHRPNGHAHDHTRDHTHDHGHDHGHRHHDHAAHDHHHAHGAAWGHAHAPEPADLAGPGGWTRGISAVLAVGLRPCSGAIIVLVFALAQGLFWVGVGATLAMAAGTFVTVAAIASVAVGARVFAKRIATARSGYGLLAMRGLEVTAALVIVAFGALLLTGLLVQERMMAM